MDVVPFERSLEDQHFEPEVGRDEEFDRQWQEALQFAKERKWKALVRSEGVQTTPQSSEEVRCLPRLVH